jgi:protein subunit release factor B
MDRTQHEEVFATPSVKMEGISNGESSNKVSLAKKLYFVLIDTFTNSIVGIYNSNTKATKVAVKLVKKNLYLLIKNEKDRLLMSEDTIEEKRKTINLLKSYVYHYKTIDQSNQIHIITDKENILRYVIRPVDQTDDEDVDEENFVLI